MTRVYLDYAATTPVDPQVADLMSRYMTMDGVFGNPSSHQHVYGQEADEAVEAARQELASLVGCRSKQVVFTSGATESDNAAIKGIVGTPGTTGRHMVTMASEHQAVLAACKSVERAGCQVSYLRPDIDGNVVIDELRSAIRRDTVLVSIMQVNNETGVIQDLAKIAEIVHRSEAFLHVDAAQGVGKLPQEIGKLGADLISVSGHKLYGPKGIGALIVGDRVRGTLTPLIDGGGQELGLRSGTLPTHQIVGFGEACRIARLEGAAQLEKFGHLRQLFLSRVTAETGAVVNCDRASTYPGILNLSFLDVDASALLHALPDVAASTASACTTGTLEPSHVLRSMGIEGARLYGAVRFSFGRYTSIADVEYATARVVEEVRRLRDLVA